MPGDAFPDFDDQREAIEMLRMENYRALLPVEPLQDEMSARADLENRFKSLTRRMHTATPPLTFIRRQLLHPTIDGEVAELHTPSVIDGRCVEVVTPGHRCWSLHNPGVWPWVARCVLEQAHNTTGRVWPHEDANGRTWTD
jgi:hypothetical protein